MKNIPQPQDLVQTQALDWLMRNQSDSFTESERQRFNEWLNQDMSHQQAYEMLEAQWQWMEPFKTANFSARSAALKYRKPKRQFYKYGAAAVAIMAIALGIFHPNGGLGMPHTYMTTQGGHQNITLADGSRVDLNTDTELRVYFNYWQRNVELIKGEAFFTVVHNTERPFQVQAGSGHIRDLGTAFDVYIKPERVIVAVQEGLVEVETTSKRELSAGHQLAFTDTGNFNTLQDSDIAELIGWREGNLVFHNKRLEEVLADIARYHDKRIYLKNKQLAELKVSGTFQITKLNDMLSAISSILPVTAEPIGDHEIIFK